MKSSTHRQEFSRGTGGWGFIERSYNFVDICWPNINDLKTTGLSRLQGKLTHGKSRKLIGVSKLIPIVPLPPINRSRSINVEYLATKALFKAEIDFLKGYRSTLMSNKMIKKTPLNAPCKKSNQIRVATGTMEIQSPTIKQSLGAQSAVAVDSSARQRKDDASEAGANANGTALPDRVERDASLHKTGQQRVFCSSDSAIETESGDRSKSDSRRKEDDSDDEEYYTEERITEWVLKVNSSLFFMGNDEEERHGKPAEEQDVTTIKIVYDRE